MIHQLCAALIVLNLVLTLPGIGQEPAKQPSAKTPAETTPESSIVEQQRLFAISLITTLADDAKSYKDSEVRTSIIARAADALWDADKDGARSLFRRAWESAEVAYAERQQTKSGNTRVERLKALMESVHGDLRSEILRLAARRDRELGEEFIQKLQDSMKADAKDQNSDTALKNTRDNWAGQKAALARFPVALRLLEDGEIDRALEIAAPVLDQVTANSISFLSALRSKRPQLADQYYVAMLAHAEADPTADANTASGLSSYLFNPNLYMTFGSDGNATWGSMGNGNIRPPDVSPSIRDRFFRAAANILLRPVLPPDQDTTSAGRAGKYMVIRRLLPLFEQNSPELASALRVQLTSLEPGVSSSATNEDGVHLQLIKQGIGPAESPADVLQKMQERIDKSRTPAEREAIYEETALTLGDAGDLRARSVADKIENKDRRLEIRQYIDFVQLQRAAEKNEATEVIRLVKTGELSHVARVWGYTRAAKLLMKTNRVEALQYLEEAAAEARRIDAADTDRPRCLISVASVFGLTDSVRSWEIAAEAVKAANAAEKFTGEKNLIIARVMTRTGFKIKSITAEDFQLAAMMKALAKNDLYRSVDLAKSLQNPNPRALAILAIASTRLSGWDSVPTPALK